jgi:hypothetical protein
MNWNFILRSTLFMGPISLLSFTLAYVFNLFSFGLILGFYLFVTLCGLALVRAYTFESNDLKSWAGFTRFFLHIYAVFVLALVINVLFRYTIYNHVDPDYRFELAEQNYQRLYEHRLQKDLPLPDKPNRAKIIQETSFVGLVTARKTDIIALFVFALLAYLPALFFLHLRTDLGPR